MKSLLLGNGINIQFGGAAYTSSFIMKRIKYRALMDSYAELFDYKIAASEIVELMNNFVDEANNIIRGQHDEYTLDDDTKEALVDFKTRYSEDVNAPDEIMLEDWLFIVHMFFLKNPDLKDNYIAAMQGFERLLLDAIYNDGLIQNLHKKMPKSVCKFLKRFDSIFTLNYDNNVEIATGKQVFHLHGDFSVLADSENLNVVNGFLRNENGETIYLEEMNHCFCNALLNYSGRLKRKHIQMCDDANEALDKLVKACISDRELLERLKVSKSDVYAQVMTKIKNPELKAASEYHYSELCHISGELHVLGMSPNNDAHIFDAILNNERLEKVIFYYRDLRHKEYIMDNYPRVLFECRDVNTLWRELRCEQRFYNYSYKLPKKIDDFVKIGNSLSGDKITTDQVIQNLKQVSKSDMLRFCKLVKEDIEKRNPGNFPMDENDFANQRASISYIALQQGIQPTVLFLICIMNFKYIVD